jgi:hypothetical protein
MDTAEAAPAPRTPVRIDGGCVRNSSRVSPANASCGEHPHISSVGRKLTQTAGRSGFPNSAQRISLKSWIQGTPAGFPPLIPGMGVEILGAMQQAPQPVRQVIALTNVTGPRKQATRECPKTAAPDAAARFDRPEIASDATSEARPTGTDCRSPLLSSVTS